VHVPIDKGSFGGLSASEVFQTGCKPVQAAGCRRLDARDQCRLLDTKRNLSRERQEPRLSLKEGKRETIACNRMPAKDHCCDTGGSM
jgi:hypothetical protein